MPLALGFLSPTKMPLVDIEKETNKATTQVNDNGSSNEAAYSLREGDIRERSSWARRTWRTLHLELTETRGVVRVPPEERQTVSMI